jgi:hypothetical protein
MEQLLIASRAFEATGMFEVILYIALAISVAGTIILSKKGAL